MTNPRRRPEIINYFRLIPVIGLFLLLFLRMPEIMAREEENTDTNIFEDLIGKVTETPDSVTSTLGILDFISDYYKDVESKDENEETYGEEEPDNPVCEEDVLGYITGIYSDHDYYELGYWGRKESQVNTYVPYKGQLPDYELSDFRMPVNGCLTSIYGYRPKYRRYHKGIDLRLQRGDTIRCALPGVVTKTGYDPGGYGNFVVVSHSGEVETLYGHLAKGLVNPGFTVEAGDPIGIGGTTGNSTGPHLHFETRYRGVPLDPLTWFNIPVQ